MDGRYRAGRILEELREGVRAVCKRFNGEYWRALDAVDGYPTEFVAAITEAGFLGALIPEQYGGAGLGILEASVILEEINRSGGNAGACHAQMYTMGTILRHGSEAQKEKYLPRIANGTLRLQAFGVTEPNTGTDTTNLKTFARREGDHYVANGQKVFISRTEHSDLMILLVRTTPKEDCVKKSDGLSVLIVDLNEAVGNGLDIRPIKTMMNHATTEQFVAQLEAGGVPVAQVKTMQDVLLDPQQIANNLIVKLPHYRDGDMYATRIPLSFSSCDVTPTAGAPVLGQHNEAILKRGSAYDVK